MASLENTKIKDTFKSLLKTIDNSEIDGEKEVSDGLGNATGVKISNNGSLKADGELSFGSLKDTGENIVIEKFVDEADGIANNDNDTTIPTSAAIVDYVDAQITLEDLDFTGNTGTGNVDLDSESFDITGSNGITTNAENNTLEINGSALQTAINTNTGNIATNTSNISSNATAINTNTGNISTNISSIGTNATNITNNATAIAGNTSNITTNATNIATNTTNITTNTGNIATNTTDIAGNTSDITTNASNITTNTTNIATNTTDIATNVSAITQNTTDIGTNTTNIATNASNISTNTASISTNATGISTNATNIAGNSSSISTNATNITNNSNSISANTTNISTNATNIASNDTDISALQTDVSANTTNISTNATNIASNDTDISTNAGNISTNTTNIGTNTSNISTNTSNISSNTTAIAGKVSRTGDTGMTGNYETTGTITATNGLKVTTNQQIFNYFGGLNIYSGAGTDINLGGGIGNMQNNVRVGNGWIYTSQGLRVGGQGTANQLDDYEEGTYNFQFRLFRDNNSDGETIGSSGFAAWNNRSKYTKVGNQVTLFIDLEYQNGSSTRWSSSLYFVGITNLPFTPIDNGTNKRYSCGGTYALESYYQSANTGHTILSRNGGYSNYGKYISFAGTLDTAYPGYGYEPIYASEFPQYRNYMNANSVKITGTVTYQTNS